MTCEIKGTIIRMKQSDILLFEGRKVEMFYSFKF